MALGLQSPWQVNDVSFAAEESSQKELHLHIGFGRIYADYNKAEATILRFVQCLSAQSKSSMPPTLYTE